MLLKILLIQCIDSPQIKNDLAPNVNGAEAEMYVLYVLYDSACTTKKVLPHIGHFLSSEINENITGLKT